MPRRSQKPHRRAAAFRRHGIVALAVGLTVSFGAAFGAPAGASPQNDLAAKTAQAKRLEAQIEQDHNRSDILDQQYLDAQQAVADAQTKIDAAQRAMARAESTTSSLRSRLGSRAARLYMGAGNADPFNIDATDVRELGSRAKYGEAAADEDQRLIDDLHIAEENLGIQRKALQRQQKDAQARQDAANQALTELKKSTANEEQLLNSVKGDMARLVSQIAAQKAAAEAAAARAAIQAQVARQRAAVGRSVDIGVDPGNIPAPSGGASAAIAYARAQLGKPYRYAGTGPDSFDCSGLTMMAWAQGGVSMPHGSQAQYDMFPKVPIDQLQPGDLVFFGSSGPSNHHVGLYVGGGTMIEAPHTGDVVKYSSIYRSDLVPLGSRP